jgi:hypothetical protein
VKSAMELLLQLWQSLFNTRWGMELHSLKYRYFNLISVWLLAYHTCTISWNFQDSVEFPVTRRPPRARGDHGFSVSIMSHQPCLFDRWPSVTTRVTPYGRGGNAPLYIIHVYLH